MIDQDSLPPKSLGQLTYEKYNEAKGGLTWDGKPIPSWDENKDESVKAAWEAAAQFAYDAGAKTMRDWYNSPKPFLFESYHVEPNIASTQQILENVFAASEQIKAVGGMKEGIANRTLALRHLEDAESRLRRAIDEMRESYEKDRPGNQPCV